MARASVLLYNFTDKKRSDRVKFIFVLLGIKIKIVEKKDYLQPIGVLAGAEGIEPVLQEYEDEGFQDEMIVINHFTDSQLNQMLAYFRKEGIQVGLKAALTDTNQYWNSMELHEEIRKEHEQMSGGQKNRDGTLSGNSL